VSSAEDNSIVPWPGGASDPRAKFSPRNRQKNGSRDPIFPAKRTDSLWYKSTAWRMRHAPIVLKGRPLREFVDCPIRDVPISPVWEPHWQVPSSTNGVVMLIKRAGNISLHPMEGIRIHTMVRQTQSGCNSGRDCRKATVLPNFGLDSEAIQIDKRDQPTSVSARICVSRA
jgi:hypothetical protein